MNNTGNSNFASSQKRVPSAESKTKSPHDGGPGGNHSTRGPQEGHGTVPDVEPFQQPEGEGSVENISKGEPKRKGFTSRNQRSPEPISEETVEQLAKRGWEIPLIPNAQVEAPSQRKGKEKADDPQDQLVDDWVFKGREDLEDRLKRHGRTILTHPDPEKYLDGARREMNQDWIQGYGDLTPREYQNLIKQVNKGFYRREEAAAVNGLKELEPLPPVGFDGDVKQLDRKGGELEGHDQFASWASRSATNRFNAAHDYMWDNRWKRYPKARVAGAHAPPGAHASEAQAEETHMEQEEDDNLVQSRADEIPRANQEQDEDGDVQMDGTD